MLISDCLQHDAIAVQALKKIVNDFVKPICEHPKQELWKFVVFKVRFAVLPFDFLLYTPLN